MKWQLGRSHREVSRSCRLSHGSVAAYLERAKRASLTWEKVQSHDDAALENLLYPAPQSRANGWIEPDWSQIYVERKRPGVTMLLLWEEYRAEHGEQGYGYSRFCQLYREYRGRLNVTMRQEHKAGEKLFVDWAGQKVALVDRSTGEVCEASLFVAAFGASQHTYAEATLGETLHEWIRVHSNALEFFGGCPEILVPDNTKTAVKSPCRYDPDLNRTYQDFADHHGVAVIPTRIKKPKDKAKVENAVLQAERWILARLRNQTFFDLASLNRAIRKLLTDLNDRPRKALHGATRRTLFEQLDRPVLKPLPRERYTFANFKPVRVGRDYHVELDRHYYSVPYQLVGLELDLKATAHLVEVFHKARPVARHRRSSTPGHTTLEEHMPKSHRAYKGWSPQRFIKWAEKTGPWTAELAGRIMASKRHPEQGYRACFGLIGLAKRYGSERLERASKRSLDLKSPSYKSVKSILRSGLDKEPIKEESATASTGLVHSNIRGAGYYEQETHS